MFLTRYESQIYAIMRIAVGFLFLWHGTQKIFNYPPVPMHIPMHVVVFGGGVEFIGGVCVMAGLFTHWAAFFASGEMAYAYWSVHASQAVLPLVNMGEMAVVYCFVFLFISARGSGVFSLDAYLAGRKNH